MCHIQANYRNDLKQEIVRNDTFDGGQINNNNNTVLDAQETALSDMFFVYCFTNIPLRMWWAVSENWSRWLMFAIHDFWKTTLIPTINSEVQQLINSEV